MHFHHNQRAVNWSGSTQADCLPGPLTRGPCCAAGGRARGGAGATRRGARREGRGGTPRSRGPTGRRGTAWSDDLRLIVAVLPACDGARWGVVWCHGCHGYVHAVRAVRTWVRAMGLTRSCPWWCAVGPKAQGPSVAGQLRVCAADTVHRALGWGGQRAPRACAQRDALGNGLGRRPHGCWRRLAKAKARTRRHGPSRRCGGHRDMRGWSVREPPPCGLQEARLRGPADLLAGSD